MITWGSLTRHSDFYQLALDEFLQNNPKRRRMYEITEEDRKQIVERANQLKELGAK